MRILEAIRQKPASRPLHQISSRLRNAWRIRRIALDRSWLPFRRRAGRLFSPLRRAEGVNLVAYIRAEMGLGEAARGMAAALDAKSVPFNIINFETGNPSRHADMSWAHRETARSDFDVTVLCVNPDNTYSLRLTIDRSLLGNRYVVGNWYWELPELPEAWTDDFKLVNEIWAPTRFIQDAVSQKSPVPVVHIPPVVRVAPYRPFPRTHFGLPERRFLFLAMADAHSMLERKNPLGALRAFKAAFGGDDEQVGLVLKFNNPNFAQGMLRDLKEEAQNCTNVFFIERTLPREELNALVAQVDCYVSLHRSEGFGLGPAEAMYLGKPAIVTNWSGNTDYMTKDNSAAVDYQLVKLGRDIGIYRADQHWAEPDIEHAAHLMRSMVADPGMAATIGRRGQETIRARFSAHHVGDLITRRLNAIRRFC